jgi:hypothetical protein
MRIHEARDDRAAREVLAAAELLGRADRLDPPVSDRDRSVANGRALDREHPVCGENGQAGRYGLSSS